MVFKQIIAFLNMVSHKIASLLKGCSQTKWYFLWDTLYCIWPEVDAVHELSGVSLGSLDTPESGVNLMIHHDQHLAIIIKITIDKNPANVWLF